MPPKMSARSLLILALGEICAAVQLQFNFQNLQCYCKPTKSSTGPNPSPGHSTYHPRSSTDYSIHPASTTPLHPYKGSCLQNLYGCDILFETAIEMPKYTTTDTYDALLNCPDSYLVKIAFKDERGDMNNLRADQVKANNQLICKNGEWWYAGRGYDRPLRHITCYRSLDGTTTSQPKLTTTSQPKSNSHLKSIPYTQSCPKNLYDCSILFGQNCHRDDDAVYYASTSMADAFANCPNNSCFAKIAFKDGKGDIDVIWHKAYFWCKNDEWKYCRDGWCRPVRHFACYKRTRRRKL